MSSYLKKSLIISAFLPAALLALKTNADARRDEDSIAYIDGTFAEIEPEREEDSIAYIDSTFAEIKPEMSYYDVESRLGHGRAVSPPGWPVTLGEVPGFEDGIPEEIVIQGGGLVMSTSGPDAGVVRRDDSHRGKRLRFVISPRTELHWYVWSVPGRPNWVAVAFRRDASSGGPFVVVTKRQGIGSY